MNWGTNLTMIGAMRLSGWVTMSTFFKTANRDRFVKWVANSLAPKLSSSDVVIMDNAQAHHERLLPGGETETPEPGLSWSRATEQAAAYRSASGAPPRIVEVVRHRA
jgi:hypothetical protein